MKVVILFDDVRSRRDATPDEWGVMEAVEAVEGALEALGHKPLRLPAGPEVMAWQARLVELGPDLVFNLCEGLGGQSRGEVEAAAAVEALGIPLTGSPSPVLALARRKDQVNALLRDNGLPVPEWQVWEAGGETGPEALARQWTLFPAIIKPAAEDGSVGIDEGAVVKDSQALTRRLQAMEGFRRLLVQPFVGDREVNAGILGGEVLPLSEIVFKDLPTGHPPLVGYQAKWAPGSPEDLGTRPVCPAPVAPSLASKIRLVALKAWRAVGGKGYGRVDFRLSAPDNLWILEVNPNPDLCPSAGLARAAAAEGITYRDLVGKIVRRAVP